MTNEQKLDKIVDNITSIKVSIARMEEQLISKQEAYEQIKIRLDVHDHQISCLEKRPGKWWDKFVGGGIAAAAGTLMAWVIEKLK